MLPEENRRNVQRFFDEVFNLGDLEVADELFSSDYVRRQLGLPEGPHGPKAIKAFVSLFRKVFPDAEVVVEGEMIAEGNKVASKWTASGHLADTLPNNPSTGDELAVSGISIFSLSENGLITSTDELILSHGTSTPSQDVLDWLLEDPQIRQLTEDEDDPWRWPPIPGICHWCHCC